MHIDPHNLKHEFPQYVEKLDHLKAADGHFAQLCETYEELDQEIHRIEKSGESISDFDMDALKLKRVHLKDDIYHRLQAA